MKTGLGWKSSSGMRKKVYTWFPHCFPSKTYFPVCIQCVPESVLHIILRLLYVTVASPCVYRTWFCPCYTFFFTCLWVCTARDFAPAIYVPVACPCVYTARDFVPVACPCVCTARDLVANTHRFDMISLQHEPSFLLVFQAIFMTSLSVSFGPF